MNKSSSKLSRSLQLLCGAAALLIIQASPAAISMLVDPDTKTITFSGSDTGASENLFETVQIASWDFGAGSGAPETVNIAPAFDEVFTNSATLTVRDGNLEDGLRIGLVNDGGTANGFTSATTNPTPISYAGLSAPFIAILESFGTDTLTLNQGSGFSSIDLTTVPEPGGSALVAIGISLAFVRKRSGGRS